MWSSRFEIKGDHAVPLQIGTTGLDEDHGQLRTWPAAFKEDSLGPFPARRDCVISECVAESTSIPVSELRLLRIRRPPHITSFAERQGACLYELWVTS